jgi:hypothetical protein
MRVHGKSPYQKMVSNVSASLIRGGLKKASILTGKHRTNGNGKRLLNLEGHGAASGMTL